ncbi:bifunctional lytic transglycosylase/C40 family peptidase [Fictibacillus terranigra]|uniref:Bifunctional lytic transglycosylase/C40 family peptidase n=1 Tax=Fictibacillus terranigra TaxID=3058424 RepID=A0ABT8EC63_9BACL|nr:bifunctional lytic transglycosylase/C40 family peptidase [Fictibacillus sp. CENA-BCM004]MDN4075498.1 bifunctional lytic transglycosylase/C40 family peptidase [Fictibacillus sp. CENA-BCM004]
MAAVTVTVKSTIFLVRNWKPILIGSVFALILMAGMLFSVNVSRPSEDTVSSPFGTANVPTHIEKWRPLVSEYTTKYGIPEYTDILLALMYQELGSSDTLDIMQSSESIGLPPNAIQDPVQSVNLGVKHFKSVLEAGQKAGVDFAAIVQSYNFGSGYLGFVALKGKKHSVELAKVFSIDQTKKLGWRCTDWRAPYCYGDYTYVQKVMGHLIAAGGGPGGADISPLGKKAYAAVLKEAQKYTGWPYVWAGAHPSTGFDCSGLTQWAFNEAGIKLPRTAQLQYNASKKIPPSEAKPGDLIFFTGTYDTDQYITHVGIYLGNGKMFDSNGSGIGLHNAEASYWKSHLAGFGRVAR